MVSSPLPDFHDLPMGEVRYLPSVSSTNDVALQWASAGAPDFSLVAADEQTAGRGRFQRRWVTPPGSALAFSLIVRPTPVEAQALQIFSPWGALAVAGALEALGLAPEIKWPNDVLLSRRKVCGILVEATWLGSTPEAVIVGIGVNAARPSAPPDSEVLFPATSVEAALGHPLDRWRLLESILAWLAGWRPRLGSAEFYRAWEARLAFRGEWVRVGLGDEPALDRLGQVLGIGPAGELRLHGENGAEFSIQVGEVHLRPAG